jgi:hypothetical protein
MALQPHCHLQPHLPMGKMCMQLGQQAEGQQQQLLLL